ncbi:MAG: DinB family protein [Cytophagales bacterium]|nr:DinB family protein [Cytophaga sp.]
MSAENTYKQLLPLAKYWLKELDFYGKNQFKRKLTDKSWSVGQIYDHLLIYTQEVHLRNIQLCLNSKEVAPKKEGKTFKGLIHFTYKGYFPIKYKCDPYMEPEQPLSAEKVKDDFYRFLKLLYKTAKDIDYKKPTGKVKHPTFGYLSAEEWFQLIEMHFRHHLRQKNKMDIEVRSNFRETTTGEDDDIPDIPYHEA